MKKNLEKILYSFGTNFSIYDIDHELSLLKEHIPFSFKSRDVVDIGCGDGKTSLKLKEILQPSSFIGVDISPALVNSARERGVQAKVVDIEKQEIAGDLGILWGVLHHLKSPGNTLKKINNSFKSLILRESIDDKRIFEVAYKLNRNKLTEILLTAQIDINQCKMIETIEKDAIIIFVGI